MSADDKPKPFRIWPDPPCGADDIHLLWSRSSRQQNLYIEEKHTVAVDVRIGYLNFYPVAKIVQECIEWQSKRKE